MRAGCASRLPGRESRWRGGSRTRLPRPIRPDRPKLSCSTFRRIWRSLRPTRGSCCSRSTRCMSGVRPAIPSRRTRRPTGKCFSPGNMVLAHAVAAVVRSGASGRRIHRGGLCARSQRAAQAHARRDGESEGYARNRPDQSGSRLGRAGCRRDSRVLFDRSRRGAGREEAREQRGHRPAGRRPSVRAEI